MWCAKYTYISLLWFAKFWIFSTSSESFPAKYCNKQLPLFTSERLSKRHLCCWGEVALLQKEGDLTQSIVGRINALWEESTHFYKVGSSTRLERRVLWTPTISTQLGMIENFAKAVWRGWLLEKDLDWSKDGATAYKRAYRHAQETPVVSSEGTSIESPTYPMLISLGFPCITFKPVRIKLP